MADKLDTKDPAATQKQLSQMWEMLDDLAEQDPESYQKFIKNNLAQGAELFTKPKPELCIRTVFNTNSRYLYVNIFSWGQITAPKSSQSGIPMLSSKLNEMNIGTSDVMVIAVGINPKVLEEVSGNSDERKQLYKLILQFIKDTKSLDIEIKYSRLKAVSKGDPSISSKWLYEASVPTKLNQNSFAQPAPDNNEVDASSVISQLANLCTRDNTESSEVKKSTKKLIEEIPSESIEKETPIYATAFAKTEEGEVLKLCITLPGVSAVSELEMRISRDSLNLSNERYHLAVKLEREIDDTSVKMEFDKSLLRITARCLSPHTSY